MSLLYSASPWTNAEPPKKRVSTMKKSNEFVANDEPTSKQMPLSIEDASEIQEERSSRVNEIIHKMTSINSENDGSYLGDFKPLEPPKLNQKKSLMDNQGKPMDPQLLLPSNPLQQPIPSNRPAGNNYSANDMYLGNLSNYQQSYTGTPVYSKPTPYYAKFGNASGDDKLMERINYMIHLLEQQQQEKTANVTEEFLLYTFLGVFVIYVVDSFSRTGKYTR